MSEARGFSGESGQDPAWDELPLDPPRVPVAHRPRPAWITVVAAILALNGISLVLSAGSIPASPVWASDPLPVIGAISGVLAFVAAAGVLRQLAWGRWLGLALAIGWLAREAALFETWLRTGNRGLEPTGPSPLVDLVLPAAAYVLVVALLIRRWPGRG
jgi:hypothetical protein